MACLRREAFEGRSGVVFCDEEGCEFRRFAVGEIAGFVGPTSAGDCLLQLRLRAGDAEDAYTAALEFRTLESVIEEFGNFGEDARWSGRSDWLHTCPDRGIIGLGPVSKVCPFCGTPQPRKD